MVAIGNVAVEAAHLEGVVEWAIWGFMPVSMEVGRLITTRQNLEAKLNTLSRLIHMRLGDTALTKEGIDLIGDIRTASTERNDILHALWRRGDRAVSDFAITRKLAAKGTTTKIVDGNPERLNGIALSLQLLTDHLFDFLGDCRPVWSIPLEKEEGENAHPG